MTIIQYHKQDINIDIITTQNFSIFSVILHCFSFVFTLTSTLSLTLDHHLPVLHYHNSAVSRILYKWHSWNWLLFLLSIIPWRLTHIVLCIKSSYILFSLRTHNSTIRTFYSLFLNLLKNIWVIISIWLCIDISIQIFVWA
jgi:hypothetical protein